jgi:hypothetical protein
MGVDSKEVRHHYRRMLISGLTYGLGLLAGTLIFGSLGIAVIKPDMGVSKKTIDSLPNPGKSV